MELSELQAKITELEQQIAELPAGSVTKKTINGNAYFYHRWTEDKKRRRSIFLRKRWILSGSRLSAGRDWKKN